MANRKVDFVNATVKDVKSSGQAWTASAPKNSLLAIINSLAFTASTLNCGDKNC